MPMTVLFQKAKCKHKNVSGREHGTGATDSRVAKTYIYLVQPHVNMKRLIFEANRSQRKSTQW